MRTAAVAAAVCDSTKTMNTPVRLSAKSLQVVCAVAFAVLIVFWVAKIGDCIEEYFGNGTSGLLVALHRHMISPYQYIPPGTGAGWGWVAMKYAEIAVLTVAFGFGGRPVLRSLWFAFRGHPASAHRA